MIIPRNVVSFTVVLIVAGDTNCSPIEQSTLNDVFDFKRLEKFAVELLDNIEKTRVTKVNDVVSIETIGNTTDRTQRTARLSDKLEDIANTKAVNLDLGIIDVRLFRNAGQFNVDLKLDPRKSKDGKEEGHMLLPLLIGLKATTFVVGVVSFIALLILKAFIASKMAILIAVVLSLKKLFGGHHKTTYEAVHDRYSIAPEYHRITNHYNEPEIFKDHPEVPEQKLLGVYDLLKDQKDLLQDNNDTPKYEYQGQDATVESLKDQDFHGLFSDNLQEFKPESHQKRRSWKSNRKRKPLSLVIGSPHHEPPVLTYRRVITGRNS